MRCFSHRFARFPTFMVSRGIIKSIPKPIQCNSHLRIDMCFSTSAKNWRNLSPYELLGVSQGVSAQDIKLAYFKAAKKSHPDLNPGDNQAQERFQRVAAAYELLRDSERRRRYDDTASYGWSGESRSSSSTSSSNRRQQQQQRQEYGHQRYDQQYQSQSQQWWNDAKNQQSSYQANEVFHKVMKDSTIISEALSNYVEDVKEEFSYATDCVQRGDFAEVMKVLNVNKGLIFGVVLPLALFIRFPALIGSFLSLGGRVTVWMLLASNRLPMAATWLWRRAVEIAMERNKRRVAARGQKM